MTYVLRKSTWGRHATVELTAEEHTTLRRAWHAIFSLVQLEETWDCVIQSYLELEQSWLSAALRSSLLGHGSYDEMHDARLGFAHRLSNFLHACRAYVDQAPQRLGDLEALQAVECFHTLRRNAHSQSFGYRLMDGLRNHAQHYGQPVQGATFDSRRIDGPEDSSQLLFSVTATIDVAELRESSALSAKLRDELSGDLTSLDASTMVRIYLEGLGAAHEGVRKHLKDNVREWDAAIEDGIARYSNQNQGDVLGLQLVELAQDGSSVSTLPIFAEMPHRLKLLMRRNRSLLNLCRRMVTSSAAHLTPS